MKLVGSALVAAGILALATTAYGEETKQVNAEAQKGGDSTSPKSKQESAKQKRAGKRQQLRRGAGPVGTEGTRAARSDEEKTPDLSPGTGLEPSATQQKATKGQQLPRGAGPEGMEGAVSGPSRKAAPRTESPDNADAPKGENAAPDSNPGKPENK